METVITDTQCTYLDEKLLPVTHLMGINDMLVKWAAKRYGVYVERKGLYLQKLKDKAKIFELKVKFIDDVIAEPPRFDIRCRSEEYIETYMKQNGYPHEFLKIPYNSFSEKLVAKIRKDLAELYAEIEWYERTHPGDMWIKDLDELQDKLEDMYPGQWKKHYGYGYKTMDRPE